MKNPQERAYDKALHEYCDAVTALADADIAYSPASAASFTASNACKATWAVIEALRTAVK